MVTRLRDSTDDTLQPRKHQSGMGLNCHCTLQCKHCVHGLCRVQYVNPLIHETRGWYINWFDASTECFSHHHQVSKEGSQFYRHALIRINIITGQSSMRIALPSCIFITVVQWPISLVPTSPPSSAMQLKLQQKVNFLLRFFYCCNSLNTFKHAVYIHFTWQCTTK